MFENYILYIQELEKFVNLAIVAHDIRVCMGKL